MTLHNVGTKKMVKAKPNQINTLLHFYKFLFLVPQFDRVAFILIHSHGIERIEGLKLPIVVISVIEYNSDSVNVHRGKRSPMVSVSPPFVAFIIEPSKRRNCSCTSIVQFRSYNTFKRSANRQNNKLVSFNNHFHYTILMKCTGCHQSTI